MDSITHALYRAIVADDAHQQKVYRETCPTGGSATLKPLPGLQSLSKRPSVHRAYADAAGTDLHISLTRGDELLALQMEFIAAGFCPPAGMAEDGAEVIVSPGRIDVMVPTDKGDATWTAILAKKDPMHRGDRKASWEEQVS